ncbi:MAG: hypothetical protein J5933_01005 [Clostridia bacterium]|nr:hypothetical protein [Clostridia bacterium]
MDRTGIEKRIEEMLVRNSARMSQLSDSADLTDYASLTRRETDGGHEITVWTEAFSAALREHEIVRIPASPEPYYVDGTVIVPSNRWIDADSEAVIKQASYSRVIMMRNEKAADGTESPVIRGDEDKNIFITGGVWAESREKREGYGSSGRFSEEAEFSGVSAFMFFSNLIGFSLTDAVFVNTAGFSLQIGDAADCRFERIRFRECFADGLHINGNIENLLVRDISGEVGDDLVALNMYDWLNSSVNFGPMRTVLCENIELADSSVYKAFRIQPGKYRYRDGSVVDCSAEDMIIRDVRGMLCFKMYLQKPSYLIGTEPEWGMVGSGRNIFFEDISVDVNSPIDRFDNYENSDPVRGVFAPFEIGADIESVSFENIDITLHKDRYPISCMVAVGPKSTVVSDSRGPVEVFDPYLSCRVGRMTLKNVRINGRRDFSPDEAIRQISFDDINGDGKSTGKGTVDAIIIDGTPIN